MPKQLPPAVPAVGSVVFPPARFVCTTVGVPDSSVVMVADKGTLKVLTRPMSSDLAFKHLDGMNRADNICQFCNGYAPVSHGSCFDCGMPKFTTTGGTT